VTIVQLVYWWVGPPRCAKSCNSPPIMAMYQSSYCFTADAFVRTNGLILYFGDLVTLP